MSHTTMPTLALNGLNKPLSRIIQGAMMLQSGDGESASFAMLDAAFARGITTFDLGHIYGGGSCDRVFGAWVRKNKLRDQVVMLAKGCHHNDDRKRVTPFDIEADIADTMARTGFDFLDCWLFHRDDPQQPIAPLVETCNRAIADGRINTWGVSNWRTARIQEAMTYAAEQGLHGPVASSPNYSLAQQIDSPWGTDCVTISGPDHAEDRAWHRRTKIPVLAWSSIARGFFSGALTRDNLEQVRHQFEEHTLRCYVCEPNWQRQERAFALAAHLGLSLPQVALAFVLSADFPTCALVGAVNGQEMDANLRALDFPLDQTTRDWLDLAHDQRPF